jgi:predicted XRE-type DNA-binding protein
MKRVNTMPNKASSTVTAFASVWDAIEATPLEAANMRAKSTLLMALQNWLDQTTGTQKAAAIHLGITQPRLSDLKRGRIDLFSLDTLLNMAEQAGLAPTIKVRALPKAKPAIALHKAGLAPRRKLLAA